MRGDSHATNVGTVIGGECKKTGTRPQFSTPHEKQQNGFTERNIQTWKLCKKTITNHAGMDAVPSFWPWAAKHAAYVLNIFPKLQPDGSRKSANDKYEGRVVGDSDLFLYTYGSLCYASIGDDMPNGQRCVYLGTAFDEGVKAAMVLVIGSNKIFPPAI